MDLDDKKINRIPLGLILQILRSREAMHGRKNRSNRKKEPEDIKKGLRFAFLVLWAQVLVTAFAAAGCADCVACVTVHAYFHVE